MACPALALQSTPPEKPRAQTKKEEARAYPPQVKEAFLRACAGFHREMIPPCKCMTLTFERLVPYEEFERLSKLKDPTNEPAFRKVAGACLKARQQQ